MTSEALQKKIDDSKDVLRLAAKMSKLYYQAPLIITYSGGKDSDVMLQLAIECLKPDEFEVLNSHTTVDAPETVYYIRDKFEKLNEMGIKATIQYPHYSDGRFKSMWSLIIDKQLPPTRIQRYCCKELKETSTPNRFIAVGVRKAESTGRQGRNVFVSRGTNKNNTYYYSKSHIKEQFESSEKERKKSGLEPNEFNVYDCKFIEQAKAKEDILCNPIYDWLDNEIWEFIRDKKMEYNPLYDKGFKRVGCIGCPMSTNRIYELDKYPKYKQLYKNAFKKMLDIRKNKGKDDSKGQWKNVDSLFLWWVQDEQVPGQLEFDLDGNIKEHKA